MYLLPLALVGALTVVGQGPPRTQQRTSAVELARELTSGDKTQLFRAFGELEREPARAAEPEIRAALLAALQQEADLERDRLRRLAAGDRSAEMQDGRPRYALIQLVVTLDGPDLLPALAPHIGGSERARLKVCQFGEAAVPILRHLYESGVGAAPVTTVRMAALLGLATIRRNEQDLSAATRRVIETLAVDAMSQKEPAVLVGAMRLAVVAGLPALVDEVRRIARGEFGRRSIAPADRAWVTSSASRSLAMDWR